MAALICSMWAMGWQQHMCWWQLHIGQTVALHNTSHCTPVPCLEVYRVWDNPQQNHDAHEESRTCGHYNISLTHLPQEDLAPLTFEVSGRASDTCPHPLTQSLPFVEPVFALSCPGPGLFALGEGESDKWIEGKREMKRRVGSSFV